MARAICSEKNWSIWMAEPSAEFIHLKKNSCLNCCCYLFEKIFICSHGRGFPCSAVWAAAAVCPQKKYQQFKWERESHQIQLFMALEICITFETNNLTYKNHTFVPKPFFDGVFFKDIGLQMSRCLLFLSVLLHKNQTVTHQNRIFHSFVNLFTT